MPFTQEDYDNDPHEGYWGSMREPGDGEVGWGGLLFMIVFLSFFAWLTS